MRSFFARAAATLALAALVLPSIASADQLTPDQMGKLSSMTKTYFHALVAGDSTTVDGMVTHNFKASSPKDGSMVGIGTLMGQIEAAKIQYSGLAGSVKLDSATTDGMKTVAMVSTMGTANTLAGGMGGRTVAGHAMHTMTWVKTPGGWKLASDVVGKHHMSM